jgi:hypothetical protein
VSVSNCEFLYVFSSTQYKKFVDTIQTITSFEMKNLKDAFEAAAETITSSAATQGATFPFVTVPQFEVMGYKTRIQSGVETILFSPLVYKNDVDAWNIYSTLSQGWIEQSREIVRAHGGNDKAYKNTKVPESIFEHYANGTSASSGPGPYAPIWQCSPPVFDPATIINYNLMSRPINDRMTQTIALAHGTFLAKSFRSVSNLADLCLTTVCSLLDGVLSEILPLDVLSGTALGPEEHTEFHEQFVDRVDAAMNSQREYYDHPHSLYVHPVYEHLGAITRGNLVGMITAVVPWDRFLANKLPPGVNGIYAVLKNNCGQSETYVINGPVVSTLSTNRTRGVGFL